MEKLKLAVWTGDNIQNLVDMHTGLIKLMQEFTDHGEQLMNEGETEEWRDHIASMVEKSKDYRINQRWRKFE